jgi:hypothetical protein
LKLKCDEPLSKVAFNFNVRRYTAGTEFDLLWIDLGAAHRQGPDCLLIVYTFAVD